MKKILSIFAVAAVVLGMASCNSNDPESKTKRFNIEVSNIAATTADLAVTPKDEQMSYAAGFITYNQFRNMEQEGLKNMFKDAYASTGKSESKLSFLLPDTKYTVLACEMAENGEAIGDIEYYTFKTANVEAKMAEFVEDGASLPFEGEVGTIQNQFLMTEIIGTYTFPDSETRITLDIVVWGDKKTGSFTSDDLTVFAKMVVDVDGEKGSGYIYRADFTGKHDAASDTYTYEGWCDIMLDITADECYRIPFNMTCTPV